MNAEQVIASQPRARRSTGSEWSILCPWHQERSPSCYVNVTKRVFMCHGCGEKGRLTKLIARLQNISWQEAAEIAGDDSIRFRRQQEDHGQLQLPEAYRALPDRGYFADAAMNYLENRGITQDQVVHHSIGFCAVGRFAFRVIVPIYLHGELVSFVARDWTGKAEQKVRYPFGSRAAEAIFNYDVALSHAQTVVITEGWADALAVERALQRDRFFLLWVAVAIGGKELTEQKRELLLPFSSFVVMLDADAQRDAERMAFQLEEQSGRNKVRTVRVDAKDPAEERIENLIRILR